MSHFENFPGYNRLYSKVFRTLLLVLVILPTGCKEEKQANEAPVQQAAVTQSTTPVVAPAAPAQPLPVAASPKPLNDLESLLAPIALYPDPLLAELLVAATYPLEVVQAQRWLETHPDLATLNSKDWDASVMRLTTVPTVIKMMNDHLDWTTQLGDAFLAKPVEVMDSIQVLRKRAKDAGFLKDTPEQKVSTQTVAFNQPAETDAVKAVPAVMKKEVISIAPAKADTVYVPQYNPETVYQAPLAAPVSTVAASPNYYPTYYPAPSSTTSTADSLLTFGAGAVVGGLLTWGIMQWADDDDDWDDHYHVNHYYGDSVCHNGNCWHGGGYYGDRGNVNVNKNVNISGNEINIDNGGHFNQNNLKPSQRPAGWRPNPKHRRGQAYPEAVQKRLGATQQPALAGQRLGAAQTLPASKRGFAEAGQLPAERRPSSADIRQQLAQKPGAKEKPTKLPVNKDLVRELPGIDRDNALQGLKNSGKAARLDSQRGENSRQAIKRETQPNKIANDGVAKFGRVENLRPKSAERIQEQKTLQRRSEAARPSAFEMPRNTGSTANNFSQRGAASVKRSAAGGNNQRAVGGGNKPRPAGGGGGKRAGAAGGLRR